MRSSRPCALEPGWDTEVEHFIVREKENSFYLTRVFHALRFDYKTAFIPERSRQQLRRLAAMAIAKHETGAKHPNQKLIKMGKDFLDSADRPDNSEQR